MPIAFDISSTKGSQFFFWFIEASVEMTPKSISVGVSAAATVRPHSTPTAASPASLNRDRIRALLVVTKNSGVRLVPALRPAARGVERQHEPVRADRIVKGLRHGRVERGKQLLALGAVEGGEQLGRERARRSV